MPLTPEEKASFEAATVLPTKLRKRALLAWPLIFIPPVFLIFTIPFVFGYMPLLAYCCYKENLKRIPEGKTSFTIGGLGDAAPPMARASYNHRMNQAGNIFLMGAGGIIALAALSAPFFW